MPRTILCLSRSYLSRLLPEISARDKGACYLHIVQNNKEADYIASLGGEVVLNIQSVVRDALRRADGPKWQEPADFRRLTGFDWSPIHADRYLPQFAPALRLRIAGALFEALSRLFETRRIDAFLSEPVALFITHAAFYLCRRHGVRPLLWANSYFPNHFYFADAIDITSPVRQHPLTGDDVQQLRAKVATFVHGVIEDRAGPAYHHSFLSRQLSRFSYFKQRRGEEPLVLRPGLGSRLTQIARFARAVAARAVFPWASDFMTAGSVAEHRYYLRALSTGPAIFDPLPGDYSATNVVFPLQYEPEASLLYFAPDFSNQHAFVETVLRALPDGHLLWVKEHPNQFGALGEAKWRALKQRYGALRFIHGRQSGRVLIRRSGLVVSISSSAGMDALLLGRRVLVAGQVFYRQFTGAVPVSSAAEIAQPLNDPANYGVVNNAAANIAELSAFGLHCYPGDPQPAHDLYSEANLDRLVAAVRQASEAVRAHGSKEVSHAI